MSDHEHPNDFSSIQDEQLFNWVRALRLSSLETLSDRWNEIGLSMGGIDNESIINAAIKNFDRLALGGESFLELDFSAANVRPVLADFLRDIGAAASNIWVDWVLGVYSDYLRQGAPLLELNRLADLLHGIEAGKNLPISVGTWLREGLTRLFDGVVVIDDVVHLVERDRKLFSTEGVKGSLSLEVYQLTSAVAYGNFWVDANENMPDKEISILISYMNPTQ
jgi:hypothetical protein